MAWFSTDEPQPRKVRKGTHSCWECRRRKVRCGYASPNDPLCTQCKVRGTKCHSQSFVDEEEALHLPDRKLAKRLHRLEELMGKLADRSIPDTGVASKADILHQTWQGHRISKSSSTTDDINLAERHNLLSGSSAVGMLVSIHEKLLQPGNMIPSWDSKNTAQTAPELAPSVEKSRILHSFFPSQELINVITGASTGPYFITGLFYSHADILGNKSEPPSTVSTVPPVRSHPTVLAKRLLQLAICMQQLSPSNQTQSLSLAKTIRQIMPRIVSVVAELVISDDQLICCLDGLQCLVLHGYWQSNAGNLRKAWLSFRRALSFGQLIGIDGGRLDSSRSTGLASDSNFHPSPHTLWCRMISCDRSLSLLLGLPVGCQDDSFASEAVAENENALEKLEKLHAVVAAKIIGRNRSKDNNDFPLTQAIDLDLERGVRHLDKSWWDEPAVDVSGKLSKVMEAFPRLILQIQHHTILILLHLPYHIRSRPGSRYIHSQQTGLRSSRAVLKLFNIFRAVVESAYSCRHVDYAALMAAMTLLIGYLGPQPNSPTSPNQLEEDRHLILKVTERMEKVFSLNHDRLSQESSGILRRLVAILDTKRATNANPSSSMTRSPQILRLNIPYFGTISINNGSLETSPTVADQTGPLSTDGYQLPGVQNATVSCMGLGREFDSGANETVDFIGEGTTSMQCQENTSSIQFIPQGPLADFTIPDLTADADDWVLQGVDATFWSLLYDGSHMSSDSV